MRTLVESKHVLVVETRGRVMLCAVLCAVALHGYVLYGQTATLLRLSMSGAAYANLAASLLVYSILLYMAAAPFSDKKTVTFHGIKNVVSVERVFPFRWRIQEDFSFADFDRFELSRPESRGFCRLRLKNGKTRRLLRLRSDNDFLPFEHLDRITRKQVEIVT